LAMLDAAGAAYYFHNDHLGTPQKMTNAGRTVVWSADYLPFGQANVTVATVENNLRFAGQYFDNETGLHYNYWRYYDPGLGRYLRADPLGLDAGVNLFTYVQNNPTNHIDPNGESSIAIGQAIFWGGVFLVAASHYFPKLKLPDFDQDDCDDNCRYHFKRCLDSPLADFPGGVFGQSRCGLCFEACKRTGGWPPKVPTTTGLVDCNYGKYKS
ncbi:MAG: RHS repeat-associated core domain-containing protein, partial [Desulfatitalea sp.]